MTFQEPDRQEPTRIAVRIDRLILDGVSFSGNNHAALKAAVETELSHLLASQGLPPRLQVGGVLGRVRGEPIQLTGLASPSELGRQIAQAVFGGIGQ